MAELIGKTHVEPMTLAVHNLEWGFHANDKRIERRAESNSSGQ